MKKLQFLVVLAGLLLLAACGQTAADEPPTSIADIAGNVLATTTPAPPVEVDVFEHSFPVVRIETGGLGGQIERNTWTDAEITVTSDVAGYNFEDAAGRIRGRGNSTWWLFLDSKLPYRIRFDVAQPMLGSEHAARDWNFIASQSDKSLMRHYSAYHFSRLMGTMYYSPFARFVHLYLDDNYMGVYMLTDQIEQGPGRVELDHSENPAETGFLIELNMRVAEDEDAVENEDFIEVNGLLHEFRFPSGNLMTPAHIDYITDFLTHIDTMIMTEDENIFNYIDLASFVDFYIIRELYKCQDVGRFSVFMQLRGVGDDRRLEMGPVWDFDLSAGNAYYQGQPGHSLDGITHPYGYRPEGVWTAEENRWYRYLMRQPIFFDAVLERWAEVRENQFPALIDHINHTAQTYQQDFERNFMVWPILGQYVWPNPPEVVQIATFMGQVDYLTNFLTTRATWLEENFWR
ncbi:MAG: CotH kinase family protein [Defluviitaleaceae bacterium]|nr:CotH kinase family protein [Defluviitaleaceae bacterium]